ncbi:MAG: hypothetical protein KF749_08080 [Bacteroidetes bacterium]|nr:hypothetical protein [Bacteroidota bacterium]MCW5894901.1 hypothetical protein [Bacteroidota bacterium]
MKQFLFAVKLLVIAYASYLVWFLTFEYHPADPLGFQAPFVLWIVDTINLFIHEAGHLFFRLFGQTLYILGGSITQCLIPLALTFVTWREKPQQAGYPLFWFGENLVNVSVYIADAPHRNLKLIKEGLIHDWHWLLSDNLDWAEPMGMVVRGVGLVVCAGAIAAMSVAAIRSYRHT